MIYQDLIDNKKNLLRYLTLVKTKQFQDAMLKQTQTIEGGDFAEPIALMRSIHRIGLLENLNNVEDYHCFVIPKEQIQMLYETDVSTVDFDYILSDLKMPYEKMFIDFNGSIKSEDRQLKGFLMHRTPDEEFTEDVAVRFWVAPITDKLENNLEDKRMSIPFINEVENAIQFYLTISKEGKVEATLWPYVMDSAEKKGNYYEEILENFKRISIALCMFINSHNVITREVKNEQTKKRRKQDKPIPKPYYFCKVETKEVSVPAENGEDSESHHSYQYDVRGHFKHFTKGAMEGKVLWCPPHRRGLANEVYIPKIYKV